MSTRWIWLGALLLSGCAMAVDDPAEDDETAPDPPAVGVAPAAANLTSYFGPCGLMERKLVGGAVLRLPIPCTNGFVDPGYPPPDRRPFLRLDRRFSQPHVTRSAEVGAPRH